MVGGLKPDISRIWPKQLDSERREPRTENRWMNRKPDGWVFFFFWSAKDLKPLNFLAHFGGAWSKVKSSSGSSVGSMPRFFGGEIVVEKNRGCLEMMIQIQLLVKFDLI